MTLVHLLVPALAVLCTISLSAQSPVATPMTIVLPTDNDALLRNDGPAFYMFVDRNFENVKSTPWEGGQYGFVRGPIRFGAGVIQMHFHEGIDIAPIHRDASGNPTDEVRSIARGEVVHASTNSAASNYGRYVVVRHDWGQGPFCSLYAHLSTLKALPGQRVEAGSVLGIMGYTGSGIDRRRAHVHVELNLFLSSRFHDWHSKNFRPSPNQHGIWNGLNLVGLNVAEFLLAAQKNPAFNASEFVKNTDASWKVVLPRKGTLELLTNYPWLGEQVESASPSWEITLADSGLPISIKPSALAVTKPTVTWVNDRSLPHLYHTRGYVSGNGNSGTLTASGVRFVELLSGDFQAPATAPPSPKATKRKR
ncbi:MAG: M23 family metallopeptidase [Roseimicrobium sp.]